jgi:hypothetical protein
MRRGSGRSRTAPPNGGEGGTPALKGEGEDGGGYSFDYDRASAPGRGRPREGEVRERAQTTPMPQPQPSRPARRTIDSAVVNEEAPINAGAPPRPDNRFRPTAFSPRTSRIQAQSAQVQVCTVALFPRFLAVQVH